MLLVERTKVIPQRSYHKILYLYPAINNTFVFLGVKGLRQDCITHMGSKGNILFEYTFQKPMDALGMLNQHQAIMIQTRGNCITILNLLTHQFKRTPHHFFNQQSDQANILTFSITKYLCIQQYGRYNDNRYKLSYFLYPLQPQSKPFSIYQAKQNQWTYEHFTRKVNQQSKVIWFKARHDVYWEFKMHYIKQNGNNRKGQFEILKISQNVGEIYGMQNLQVAVNNIWQMKENQYMIVCISNKTQNQINKQLGVIQNNYILNSSTKQVRQAKFSFGQHHDYQIDCQNIGNCSMFRTFSFCDGNPQPSPIFYIDNSTQKIIFTQQWQCSYLSKYEYPGYDSNLLIQNMFENSDCEWFQCIKKKVIKRKQVYLFFLQQIYDKWDEDLLANIIELLNDIEDKEGYSYDEIKKYSAYNNNTKIEENINFNDNIKYSQIIDDDIVMQSNNNNIN